jgi:hypothetical protein
MENLSKEKLEDVINFKQPLLLNNYYLAKNINMKQSDPNYSLFNVNIYNNDSTNLCKINLRDYYNIISNNNTTNYLSYNNEEFLQETVIDKILRNNDIFFRPPNVCNKNYDIIMGAKNNNTRLKYSTHNRNLLYVSSGLIEVTLCPPKYYKNLHVKKNYETMEFYSQIDIYNVESIYKNDFNKIKFLRLTLGLGQVLVIPPYWFYSIKFLEKHSFVFLNTYNTYINVISTLPYICMQILQLGNIKLNVIKNNYYKGQNKDLKEEEFKEEPIEKEFKEESMEKEFKEESMEKEVKEESMEKELKEEIMEKELKEESMEKELKTKAESIE